MLSDSSMTYRKVKDCFIAAFSLLVGLLIYVNSRTETVFTNLMKQWGVFDFFRFSNQSFWNNQHPFIKYQVPDMLWMLSLIVVIRIIWNYQYNFIANTFIIIAFVLGVMFEAFQSIGFTPGTFDYLDLVFTILGGLLGLFITKDKRFRPEG